MKIGTVCQTTGLTDRTIRYYIEEGLLQPACTKNHLEKSGILLGGAKCRQSCHVWSKPISESFSFKENINLFEISLET